MATVPSRIASNVKKGDKNSVSLALDSLRDWVYEPAVGQERSERAQAAVALLQPYIKGSGAGGDIASFESWTTNLSSLMVDLRRPISQNTANENADGSSGTSIGQRLAEGNRDAATASPTTDDGAGLGPENRTAPATSDDSTSAGSQGSGAAGGGATPPAPSTGGAAPSTAGETAMRQVPGDGELWNVAGTHYLAYRIPGTNTPLVWQIEDDERLDAIFGGKVVVDRNLNEAQFKALSPWKGGLSAELQNTDEDPWQVFMSKFEEQAELRPWLRDPSVMAVIGGAYLEGRNPTTDELATTDWWNDHTEDERAWMESSVTAGREEINRRMEEARRTVGETLREAGSNNVPEAVVDYIAMQRLTGKWDEGYAAEQVRKLTDPFASGKLDIGIWAALRGDAGNGGDARAIAEGKPGVLRRLRLMFENAKVPTTEGQLDRVADEILSGRRWNDVRRSVDIVRTQRGDALPGVDTTKEQEDTVRSLLRKWVGPAVAAGYSEDWIAEQAGLIRNDPDAQAALIEKLKDARLTAFSNWNDRERSYEDIAAVARSQYARVWGQAPDETDSLFLDIVNMTDQNKAADRLRREGMKRNVEKVWEDMTSDLGATPLGEQVVRSSI